MPSIQETFREIVEANYDDLFSYAAFLTGRADETEDLVHQAFLLAFDRMAGGEGFRKDAASWLRGALRNLVHAWWRQKKKLPQDITDQLLTLAENADEAPTALAKKELAQALQQCLGTLDTDDRTMLAQRYGEGRRITDIAETIRQNVSTVRVRLFRLRQALRECVESRFNDEVRL